MPTKTKAELEAEIRELKAQLDIKTKEETNKNSATELYNMYKYFVEAGFTEERAWELFIKLVNNNTAPKRSIF